MFRPTKILVPTDMSVHADKAVKQAIDIARQFNAELFLLHVIQDPVQQCTVDYCISEGLVSQLQSELMESARKGIRQQVAKFPEASDLTITTDVKTGVPHDQILQEELERGIDLVVISSLGTTGLAKYLIGSVARHVLLGSTCSVLLVK
jgi:nucleotide-binding universal stress UspA family protein